MPPTVVQADVNQTKDKVVKVRMTDDHFALISQAAHLQDLQVSTWMRQVLLREARLMLNQEQTKQARKSA